jgi:glycosyltransferase involved in cell wall biosynthesis
MLKLSVVLPVYNEEAVLVKSVEQIGSFLTGRFGADFEILVVDNGSTDNTISRAKDLANTYKYVRFMHIDEKGRGRALRYAWSRCDSEIVSYMDVDISTRLDAFPELIKAIDAGSDISIGSRWVPGATVRRSFIRAFLSGGYNMLLAVILGVNFRDAQCGFKAMKKSVYNELAADLKNDEWFFDTELLVKASRKGYKITEVPVNWDERIDRKSKVNIFGTVFDYLILILKLRFE